MRAIDAAGWLALGMLMVSAAPAAAEWQLKPFVAVTGGGETTYVDLEKAAGHPRFAFGVDGVLIGDVLGVELDFGRTPSFFQRGDQGLVVDSSATTLTGNIVLALPRRLTEYTLRPYVAGGAGWMHVHIDDYFGALRVASDLPAFDVGGGVTGFLTNRFGLSWDVRYFRSVGGKSGNGVSFGEQLSFWRANMAVVIRY
jgi:hypothetical protein